MEKNFITKLLCTVCLVFLASLSFAQTCEFLGLPASPVVRNNDPGACEACIILPVPTLSGQGCAGIPDPNSAVTLGPQQDNLNIAPFNPGQNTLGVTNYTMFGATPNAPAGSTVTISGFWNSDNSFFTEVPSFSLEGYSFGNLPFGGPDCQANNYSFSMPAVNYNAAAADGQLDFTVGADTDVNSFCAQDIIETQVDYFTSTVPFANDFNGTTDASGCYPVGTTTVCYTVNQTGGLPPVVECFDVTVIDAEGPTYTNCPGDFTVTLDPGDCAYNFNFIPQATDNCPAMAQAYPLGPIQLAGSQAINCNIGNVSTGNQHFRTFTVPAGSPLTFQAVDMVVSFLDQGGVTITANVYTATSFPGGVQTLIASGSTLSTGAANYLLNIPVIPTGIANPGDLVVIEIIVPAGVVFFPGYGPNNSPTWLQAAACGAPTPTNVNAFGITNGLQLILHAAGVGVDIAQTFGPDASMGIALPIGTQCFTYVATDAVGITTECDFCVTVTEFPNVRTQLACNDNVQISLDENCRAVVGADDILEGGPYGCYDSRYRVIIDRNGDGIYNLAEGNTLTSADIGLCYNVQVTDLITNNKCWGRFCVEDKLIPDLVCEDVSLLCSADLTPGLPITGTVSETVNSGFSWASVGGNDEVLSIGGAPSNATVTDVNVSIDLTHTWVGDVVIDVTSPSGTNVVIVQNQCGINDNIDATFDDEGNPLVCGNLPAIGGIVIPQNALSAFDGESVNGDWTVTIGDGVAGDGGTINEVSIEIAYAGVNSFPTGPNATVSGPNPDGSYTVTGFDACGPATLTYTDSRQNNNCGDDILTRAWKITDGSGNMSTCNQTITLIRATLADVEGPENYDGIQNPALLCENICGGAAELADNRSCGPSNIYWNPLPANHVYAGHPSPYDGKTWPCGVVKCFGTGTPTGGNCGDINMTFEDTRINICPAGSSTGCFKVLRKWTVLDWCTGDVAFFNQIIKVEDNEAPTIADLDDLTISTDVWRCEADWIATTPWIDDNCSDILDYTVSSTGGTVSFSNGRWIIRGLLPGTYQVTYSVADCCGNVGEETIDLTVIDDVPPVAICDQHTVVSITRTGNINQNNLGTTKIFASTFDDGSFDNCNSQVWFKAVRMNEYDSNGNGKTPETVPLNDWEAIDCDGINGDDDLRRSPPFHPNYNKRQAYFDDYVKFCCADITDGPIMVVFAVFDIDPEPFTFGKQYPNLVPAGENPDDYNGVLPEFLLPGAALDGHYSLCMVEVTVQDKLPPVVVAPPNITVTCDKWFPFDADNPNDYTDELDAIFGKVIEGSADPADRDSIVCLDRVCPSHPRFAEFAPASIFDDPCYDDQYEIFWGYDGYAIDNCEVDLEQTIIPNLHCARGTILRRWRAGDAAGNWSNIATQTITIIDCKEWWVPKACWRFTPKDVGECDLINVQQPLVCNNVTTTGLHYLRKLIEWPCDIELTRCQGPTSEVFKPENLDVFFNQDRRPRFDDDNCSLMASSYEDQVFTFVDSSCLKIFRHWTVIDWCLYEDFINGAYNGQYEWEWTQVIKLLNQEGPTFDDCSDRVICGFGNPALTNPNANQCIGSISIDPGIDDDCTNLNALRIDWKFDYFNDGSYDELGYSDTYGNVYPFPNPNNVPVRRFAPANYQINGFYPVGTHRILYAAEDGCGNLNICDFLVTINDCKPPTAYCLPGVSTIPMPVSSGGFIDIWASDFDLDSYDNCTAQADLRFSFSLNPNDRSIRRTCADVTGLPEALTIYVWDLAGNYSTCEVGLLLSDCLNQTQYTISGGITNEEGDMVEKVEVNLEGDMNDMELTGAAGFFDFLVVANQNYTVRPEKDINPLNGVSTYDLVLISKHILGVESLGSPYKMIAADVNRSGSITTFDIVELRKLILFINTDFPNNTSWRFVDSHFNFPNPANPFQTAFPEDMSVNGIGANINNADFIGVKVGDVNCSAQPNNLIGSDGRSMVDDLVFSVDDKQLTAGAEYTVNFTAKDFAATGYQFSLNFDKSAVAFAGVEAGELTNLTDANFGLSLLNEGVITTSWANSAAVKMTDDAVVFSVTFRAKRDVLLSEVLSVSSDYTVAEAYNADLELMNVVIEFNATTGAVAADEFALMQNQPNPFKDETTIGFVLPQASTATLTVYDVAGRVLKIYEGDYAKGYNEVSINRSELAGVGVLYYTLQSDDNSATKKMIILE